MQIGGLTEQRKIEKYLAYLTLLHNNFRVNCQF